MPTVGTFLKSLPPYALGARLRSPGSTPLPNPPLGVPGVSDYQGLVRLVGESAAKGLVRLFASDSVPWPFWHRLEERGSYLIVTELKKEFAQARESKTDTQRPVADYLRVHATKEQREATIERGLRAILERRGIEVGRYAEEAIEREIFLIENWIEDPQKFLVPTASAEAIINSVMERLPKLPNPDEVENLEVEIGHYFDEILKAEYGQSERVQQKAREAYEHPLVLVNDLFPRGLKNCSGVSKTHFLGGEIGVLSHYGLIMERFVRFHEAIHIGDSYPIELMNWLVSTMTLGLFRGLPSRSKARKSLYAYSEQKARYYDWQLAQRFFRGHEVLILQQALALQLDTNIKDPTRAAQATETYFGDLMMTANSSLFDYLLNSLKGYGHLGIIRDPENPVEGGKDSTSVFFPHGEGRTFMTSPETAERLREQLPPGSEIVYVTVSRRGEIKKVQTFRVPPK